jgi:hypothetical protein
MSNTSDQSSDVSVQVEEEVIPRPYGVTVIAVLLFLYAALLAGTLVYVTVKPDALRTSDWRRNSDIAWLLVFETPIRIGLALLLGAGILKLRRWARKGLIFFAGMAILSNLGVQLSPVPIKHQLTYAQEIEILACVLLIGYLVSPHVSNVFEIGPQSDD